MNPPLNCGAKIATKIESANFSVKKVHFSAKTARQGAFGAPKHATDSPAASTGRRDTPPSTAPSGAVGHRKGLRAGAGGQAQVDSQRMDRRWAALFRRTPPSAIEPHRAPGRPAPIRQPEHTGAHRRLPRRTHRAPRRTTFHCPIAPVTAPVTLPPGRRFRGRRLHYRPSCLIFDFRKPQNSASRENTFPR